MKKTWFNELQKLIYLVIVVMFIGFLFKSGYLSFQFKKISTSDLEYNELKNEKLSSTDKTQFKKKGFYCKVISDFNQCLFDLNTISQIHQTKIPYIYRSGLNQCFNYSGRALNGNNLQYLNDEKNTIAKVLLIPEIDWIKIKKSLYTCIGIQGETKDQIKQELANKALSNVFGVSEHEDIAQTNQFYDESVCYIKTAYKILEYCY